MPKDSKQVCEHAIVIENETYFLFQNVDHNSKLRSKRGLLPFVELNGEEIADSEVIIKQLTAKYNKDDPAANLSAEQKNVQHAMVTMVENHLQW